MFVIKFNDKYYYYGNGIVGTDINKSWIYNDEYEASMMARRLFDGSPLTGWESNDDLYIHTHAYPDTYKIVKVKLSEVE